MKWGWSLGWEKQVIGSEAFEGRMQAMSPRPCYSSRVLKCTAQNLELQNKVQLLEEQNL